ncbi:MAG TPA: hypothetical protein VNO26_01985 [Candidatus Limnocylindria bacterium]|nr:hypothetical protein [Candidatus Limnocylindria bacterium]
MSRTAAIACALVLLAAGAPAQTPRWSVLWDVRIVPTEGVAHVVMTLGAHAGVVEKFDFLIDPQRLSGFEGDGHVDDAGNRLRWTPPPEGGQLRWTFRIDHLRDNARYDARAAEHWVLFRGDDLVPPARMQLRENVPSDSRLQFRLPAGWTVVTPYPRAPNGVFQVAHSHRLFSRPTGWILAGRLGVLREQIAGTHISIAGPVGQEVRRQDMLALLRWTLPTLRRMAAQLPPRLLVVSAGDPMWRGGLSGPQSLFIHAARPLITPDGSSPLLHETVHTLMGARAGEDGDWIVEGMAEYYSLQALVRSRTISQRRYERAMALKRKRARRARSVRGDDAVGDVTAKAVVILADLDQQIRLATSERASLDDVLARLSKSHLPITTARLRHVVEKITRKSFRSFFEKIR